MTLNDHAIRILTNAFHHLLNTPNLGVELNPETLEALEVVSSAARQLVRASK